MVSAVVHSDAERKRNYGAVWWRWRLRPRSPVSPWLVGNRSASVVPICASASQTARRSYSSPPERSLTWDPGQQLQFKGVPDQSGQCSNPDSEGRVLPDPGTFTPSPAYVMVVKL